MMTTVPPPVRTNTTLMPPSVQQSNQQGSSISQQPQFHRPSPYMRRVQLPRLRNFFAPYECDDDLPSPDELSARLEFLQMKNAEIRQHKLTKENHQRTAKREQNRPQPKNSPSDKRPTISTDQARKKNPGKQVAEKQKTIEKNHWSGSEAK